MKPYLNEYSYVLRSEGDNQGVVRFQTSEEAAKAVQELKDKLSLIHISEPTRP